MSFVLFCVFVFFSCTQFEVSARVSGQLWSSQFVRDAVYSSSPIFNTGLPVSPSSQLWEGLVEAQGQRWILEEGLSCSHRFHSYAGDCGCPWNTVSRFNSVPWKPGRMAFVDGSMSGPHIASWMFFLGEGPHPHLI